jgi:small-conductance mechanosensitive channel
MDLLNRLFGTAWTFFATHDAGRFLAGLALALGTWAVAGVLVRAGLRVAEDLVKRTNTTLDDELLGRVRRPAGLLGPVLGAHAFAWYLDVRWVEGGASLVETMVLTYLAVATFEILVIETWLEKRQGLIVPGPVRQLVIGLAYGAVLLGIGGEVLGFDLTPLLATGSVTSLVLGLALQQPLSNLFAGIVLHIERHPTPGDWVLVDGREGEVLEIGWRSTRLRTFSGDVLLVPNNALLNATLLNFNQPTRECGRPVPVPVPLDVPPHVFDLWAREVLESIDGVVGPWEGRTKTWLVSIDDHCQRYVVRFWAREFRIHDDLESELLKRLWYRFHQEGLAFPSPQRAVRLVGDTVPAAFAGLEAARPSAFPPDLVRPTGTAEPTPRPAGPGRP